MLVGSDVDSLSTFGNDLFHGRDSDTCDSLHWWASDRSDRFVLLEWRFSFRLSMVRLGGLCDSTW